MNSTSTPAAGPYTSLGPEGDETLDPRTGTDHMVKTAEPGSIVVGHDGSAGSESALAFALQLASQIDAPVIIVRAWSMVTAPRPGAWTFGYVPSADEFAAAVRTELAADTKSQVEDFPTVMTTCLALHAGPARSLILASRDARMLVVGSRGLSGLSEMVLGSVSDQCVREALCPVVVTKALTTTPVE